MVGYFWQIKESQTLQPATGAVLTNLIVLGTALSSMTIHVRSFHRLTTFFLMMKEPFTMLDRRLAHCLVMVFLYAITYYI